MKKKIVRTITYKAVDPMGSGTGRREHPWVWTAGQMRLK